MAQKKKSTNKKNTKKVSKPVTKKQTKKKNNKKNITPILSNYSFKLIINLILFFLSILAILQMGVVGKILDVTIKYLFGSFSYILYFIFISSLLMYMLKIRLTTPKLVILIFVLLDFCFELFYLSHNNLKHTTFETIYNESNKFYGGGIIGYLPVKFLIYLLSYYGAMILIISSLLTTILIYLNYSYRKELRKIYYYFIDKFDTNDYEYAEEKEEIVNLANELHEIEENSNQKKYNDLVEKDMIIDISNMEETEVKDSQPFERRRSVSNQQIVEPKEEFNNTSLENIKNNYDNYKLPPISLLSSPQKQKKITKEDIVEKSKILQSTFKNFGIEVKIVKAIVGPTITQFQILPTPGTKVSKIVNLSNDIALNLAAKDIRIEAPIPGKSLIGIEIPNTVTQLVSMKEVFTTGDDNSPLSVALGKDVTGEAIFTRLDKMPHLLVAGSTGSGKSVCINTIITSILLKNKPDKVKLIMIDPKMVELSIYDGIPHLLTSVVTNPVKAADVLHKVVLEMENRYKQFARARVRNIEGYNKLAEQDPDYQELPYIVVIIDELADLMMVASKEVEESIARISQMARAAGIHLIIATQRPSVDVITGVIKTNIPSRIAFAVSSSIDSRTILDKAGAETLLGRGDMLFLSSDSSKPLRIQGAFLSDEEVEKIVDYIKTQSEAQYDPNMTPSENNTRANDSTEEVDPLYKEVLLFIATTQKASASLLQRKFKIGYNRAARIIDMLEEDGYIGPVEGSKPRKVFLEPAFAEDNE